MQGRSLEPSVLTPYKGKRKRRKCIIYLNFLLSYHSLQLMQMSYPRFIVQKKRYSRTFTGEKRNRRKDVNEVQIKPREEMKATAKIKANHARQLISVQFKL